MKDLRSRLYDCTVFHARQNPVGHRFTYHYVTFCLDLDEVAELAKRSRLFGTQAGRPLRFVAADSIFGTPRGNALELKKSVIDYAKLRGIREEIARVECLAHVRTLGYSYNPAAFFFGYGSDDRLCFAIVEVTNTFREKKAYFIPAAEPARDEATGEEKKLFYVSPFADLETQFEFQLKRPGERLFIRIDSQDAAASRVVHSQLTGRSRPLTDGRLVHLLVRFPFLTLGVMAKIHFQAAWLYWKGVPFIRKSENPELQKRGLP